ncbi:MULTISPECIES: RseA family anti-sigma factor [unclassified Vibrio]|uniref:Anti-sigma-E factor RseA n=1 Tax=Vibrio sp. HB236076 TaxID=3232307 RepID=A0AB39H9W0_9VIBR|nr:RseA family anti-sigma factor [Vibrio sp. HB161653]MDP5253949.1 RseA family anti-sigma factor [Vibrio sp. HB161653]
MADKEKISALMDGELLDHSLIEQLTQSSQDQEVWQDYHTIADIMRGETPSSVEWDIAGKVALALEQEPAHQNIASLASSAELESQPVPTQVRRHLPKWLNPLGQVAVAACVSMVVIFGVQQYQGEEANSVTASTSDVPVLQTVPLSGSAEPVSWTRSAAEKSSSQTSLQEQRKRIHAMLSDYELQLRLNSVSPSQEMNASEGQ